MTCEHSDIKIEADTYLREQLAIAAMQAIVSKQSWSAKREENAELCWQIADDMLKAKNRNVK